MSDEKITNLEKNHAIMCQKLDQISADVKDIKNNSISKLEMELSNRELVEEIFGKAEEKFASKRVELIVYSAVGAFLLWGLNQIFKLI